MCCHFDDASSVLCKCHTQRRVHILPAAADEGYDCHAIENGRQSLCVAMADAGNPPPPILRLADRLGTVLVQPQPPLQFRILIAKTFRKQALQPLVFFLERNEILEIIACRCRRRGLLPNIIGLL